MCGPLKKCISLVLALMLALSAFSLLPVAAAKADETASGTRFVFSSLVSENGAVYETEDAPVSLLLNAASARFDAKGLEMLTLTSNAFYVSLVNESSANAVHITYTYTENSIPKQETVSHSLTKRSGVVQSFTVGAPHIDENISALSFAFSSDEGMSGSVTLSAFFNLSTYIGEDHDEVTITRCHYNAETGKIEIAGGVSYEAAVFYAGQTLALFALAADEELHLSSKTPIDRTGVSFEFSFEVDADSADALFYRYVVAAVNDQGERIPLSAPVFPTMSATTYHEETGFKGFHAESLSTVLDCAPGIEIVDVYLDRLHGTQSSGILYAGEHSYYYFDAEYVNEIDRRVRNLTGIGTHVYLRFLVSADANGLSYTDYSETDIGVVNKLPVIRNEKAQQDVYAITNFLTARYADTSIGRISGIVLGRSADRGATYSYASADGLAAYTALYATTLNLIAGTAVRNISDIRIVVPISDRIWPGYLTEEQLEKDYFPVFFLPSLLCALTAQVLEPQPFSLMLESQALPDRVSARVGDTYGVEGIADLLSMVEAQSAAHGYLDTSVFYAWTPCESADADQLKAAYLYLYLALLRREEVESFITDLSLAGDAQSALTYLACYVDTDRFDEVSESAMIALGIGSIKDLYEDLEESAVKKRRIRRTSLTQQGYQGSIMPLGSYTIWNFSAATGTLGWYVGNGCKSLSAMTDANGQRALRARMDAGADYGDVAYHFSTPTDLSFAPLMNMQLAVNGVANARYEVQLRLCGERETTIASAVLTSGEKQTLYFDMIASKEAIGGVRSLRLVARALDGQSEDFEFSLYAFTLESETLGSAELAERVIALGQGSTENGADEEEKRDLTRPLIISAIVVLASAAITAFVIFGTKTRQRLTKKGTRV